MDIDLNADLGEGAGSDAELMPLRHVRERLLRAARGRPEARSGALELARGTGSAVGAHPGYPDREHFGRRELRRLGDRCGRNCVAPDRRPRRRWPGRRT